MTLRQSLRSLGYLIAELIPWQAVDVVRGRDYAVLEGTSREDDSLPFTLVGNNRRCNFCDSQVRQVREVAGIVGYFCLGCNGVWLPDGCVISKPRHLKPPPAGVEPPHPPRGGSPGGVTVRLATAAARPQLVRPSHPATRAATHTRRPPRQHIKGRCRPAHSGRHQRHNRKVSFRMSDKRLPPGVVAVMALFVAAAVINADQFIRGGYDWDKLVIAILFITLAVNVMTLEKYKKQGGAR